MVGGVWVAAMSYTVGYCALFGYGPSETSQDWILGFPSWVVWGILVPWGACIAFSWWFAMRFIKDDPLGETASTTADEAPPPNDSA